MPRAARVGRRTIRERTELIVPSDIQGEDIQGHLDPREQMLNEMRAAG